MRRACLAVVFATAVLTEAWLFAGTATADGLPVLGVDVGATGVASAARDTRYVTLPAGSRTIVARVDPSGGRVLASRSVNGTFTIPAVAYDGSAGGLSADGRTLVLIEPRTSFPRARTTFRVLAAPQLRPRRVVKLRGDFSFDAISPHGTFMYLIQYTVPTDPSRYLVRAYDLHTYRLLSSPVVDPRELTDKMRGSPLTRASSPDGRWAYTLYDGAGGTPFIHALDTTRRTARCIDLDTLTGTDLSQLRLVDQSRRPHAHRPQEPAAARRRRHAHLSAQHPATRGRTLAWQQRTTNVLPLDAHRSLDRRRAPEPGGDRLDQRAPSPESGGRALDHAACSRDLASCPGC